MCVGDIVAVGNVFTNCVVQFVIFHVENRITVDVHTNSFHLGVMALQEFLFNLYFHTRLTNRSAE